MGLFGGDSSSSSTTENFDQRKVLSGGSVDSGGGNVQVLDNGAVSGALSLATTATNRNTDLAAFAIDASGKQASRGVDLAAFAIDSVGTTAGKAFAFGNSALNFGSDALSGALAGVDKAQTKAFNFAGDTVSGAFDFATKNDTRAFNFGADALSGAFGFAAAADTRAANAQRDALLTAKGSLTDAMAFGGKQTAAALDSLNTSANLVKDAYADAKGRGAMTDYILFAAIGLAALVAYNATRN